MFNRPPPPYPGQGPMRGPMRFPGPFPGDQRFPFPNEGQGPRTPLPGDPNLRPRLVLYHSTLSGVLYFITQYLTTNLKSLFI